MSFELYTKLAATNLVVVLFLMLLIWLVSLYKRNASIVDPFWGFGFVVVAWTSQLFVGASNVASVLIVGMATIWGLRLCMHLLWRNRGESEDYRYREMRERHGDSFWRVSLFTVFGLQGLLLWFISWPIQFGQMSPPDNLHLCHYLGIAFWLVGMFFETVGDYQLARFRSHPENKGKVLDRGLWRYTRHPNYFGDFCVWWGLYLVALGNGTWWTLLSPLLMTLLLIKVSGAALLEKTIADRRPDYQRYIERTNTFFPGPPQKST